MRFIWVDAGNDPAYSVLEKHAIDGCFFDVRDSRLSASYLSAVRAKGCAVGVYVVDNWPEIANGNGAEAAEWMHARVKEIVPFSTASFPKVQFDLERHDPEWIADCLTRWRAPRPKQDTSWTMEPMQGGWMSPTFVQRVLNCRVRVVPQYYGGQMQPFAADRCFRNLLIRGFPENIISGFYDAAALPIGWSGWAFTQGRLA